MEIKLPKLSFNKNIMPRMREFSRCRTVDIHNTYFEWVAYPKYTGQKQENREGACFGGAGSIVAAIQEPGDERRVNNTQIFTKELKLKLPMDADYSMVSVSGVQVVFDNILDRKLDELALDLKYAVIENSEDDIDFRNPTKARILRPIWSFTEEIDYGAVKFGVLRQPSVKELMCGDDPKNTRRFLITMECTLIYNWTN